MCMYVCMHACTCVIITLHKYYLAFFVSIYYQLYFNSIITLSEGTFIVSFSHGTACLGNKTLSILLNQKINTGINSRHKNQDLYGK